MDSKLYDSARVHQTANISPDAVIISAVLKIGAGVIIDSGVRIEGDDIVIEEGVVIGHGVTIKAKSIYIGYKTQIAKNCVLQGLQGCAEVISFGDYCILGESATVLLPKFILGDYITVHKNLLANGNRTCCIGHNSWIGQNCVLNANDFLTIGNGVGVGAYSSIYTHAFFGELLEGCQVFNVAPVTIEDNVWIVGSYNVISPGVTLGERSMVLTSSVVSKSVPPLHVVGGVPAKDLTERLIPFLDFSLSHKFEMMKGFVKDFVQEQFPFQHESIDDGFRISALDGLSFLILLREQVTDQDVLLEEDAIIYTLADYTIKSNDRVSIFDISTKTYKKRRTVAENRVIRFMNNSRARFVPAERIRVVES